MIRFSLFLMTMVLFSFKGTEKGFKQKVIVAILAHPDDEMSMAPVLAKYAKTDKVYLIIGLDGRFGIKEGFPTGDSLVKLREKESYCACEILGINPPMFLGFSDMLSRTDVPEFFKQVYYLKKKIKEKIEELHPDIILTFGPDGDTGHSDHRLIGNLTTEVVLNEGWTDQLQVYYLAWSKVDSDKLRQVLGFGLNTVHTKYYNLSIQYSEEEEQKMIKSLNCYKSQVTAEEVKIMAAVEKKDSINTIHFRKLITSNSNQKGF